MASKTKLKPCPWCHGCALTKEDGDAGEFILCNGCGSQGPVAVQPNHESALQLWNRRPKAKVKR